MIYKIYSRWDETKVLFEREGSSLREVIIAAVEGGADLRGADLRDADLRGADLRDADLRDAKQDLWEILLRAPKEIAGLKQALIEGRVNGSCYEGECACLIGTIANVRHVEHTKLGTGLEPNASRPAERWFLAIRKGDTQETNPVVALTVEWIDEFRALLANAVKP